MSRGSSRGTLAADKKKTSVKMKSLFIEGQSAEKDLSENRIHFPFTVLDLNETNVKVRVGKLSQGISIKLHLAPKEHKTTRTTLPVKGTFNKGWGYSRKFNTGGLHAKV